MDSEKENVVLHRTKVKGMCYFKMESYISLFVRLKHQMKDKERRGF